MSGHTPGPWKVMFSKSGYPYQIRAKRELDGPGAITHITRWGAISFPSSAEGLANARLIAAAPDLLRELKSMHGDPGVNEPGCSACAAIAKAEGK